MVQQSGEPFLLVLPRSLAHTTQSLGHLCPALCRLGAGFPDVLLGLGPSLHHLRCHCLLPLCSAAFHVPMPGIDSPLACLPGFRFWLHGPTPTVVRRNPRVTALYSPHRFPTRP